MSTERDLSADVNRVVRSWLREDRHEDADRVLGAVLDEVDTTPQRRSTRWAAWRDFFMDSNVVRVGLVAAAVVVIAVIAINLLPGTAAPGGPPSATPEPSVAEPSPSEAAGLPVGSTLVLQAEQGISVTIPAPGWEQDHADPVSLARNGGAGAVDRAGAWVFGGWGGEPLIPSDPCQWASTMPDTPASTLDEIAAALASQATRDASAPEDVTVDGHSGRSITLHVPADIAYVPSNTGFTDCDEGKFCTLGFADEAGVDCHMWYMAPDEFQEIWIVDVDGEFIFMPGNYLPNTPPDIVEELQAILGSMTFSP